MNIIKYIILLMIFSITTTIGILISKKYVYREKELKEIKIALNMFLTKIKFTYEPISDIFKEISENTCKNVSNIFYIASKNMKTIQAGQAWNESLKNSENNLKKEDVEILKGLAKLLGKTSIEGQISEIELTSNFIDKQIKDAENERIKNEKLYKTLGMTIGIAIVIILV